MPMLSAIEVATVADTSKPKKRGRPPKNVGKGAITDTENNNRALM